MGHDLKNIEARLPPGFQQILLQLSIQILRNRPYNIYQFCANYFDGELDRRTLMEMTIENYMTKAPEKSEGLRDTSHHVLQDDSAELHRPKAHSLNIEADVGYVELKGIEVRVEQCNSKEEETTETNLTEQQVAKEDEDQDAGAPTETKEDEEQKPLDQEAEVEPGVQLMEAGTQTTVLAVDGLAANDSEYLLCNNKRLSDEEKAIYAAVSDAILTAETNLQMIHNFTYNGNSQHSSDVILQTIDWGEQQECRLRRTSDANQGEYSQSVNSASYTLLDSATVKSRSYTIVNPGSMNSRSYTIIATYEHLEKMKKNQNYEHIPVPSHDATTNTHGDFQDERIIANYCVDSVVHGAVTKVLQNSIDDDFVGKPVSLMQDVATTAERDHVIGVQNMATSTQGDIEECVISQQTDAMQDVSRMKKLSIESLRELARLSGFLLVSMEDAATLQDGVLQETHVISTPTEEVPLADTTVDPHDIPDIGQNAAGATSAITSDDNVSSCENVTVMVEQHDNVEHHDDDSSCTESDTKETVEGLSAERCVLCEPNYVQHEPVVCDEGSAQHTVEDQQEVDVSCSESADVSSNVIVNTATDATGAVTVEGSDSAATPVLNTEQDYITVDEEAKNHVTERVATFLQYTNNEQECDVTATGSSAAFEQHSPDSAEHVKLAENMPNTETTKPPKDTSNANDAGQLSCHSNENPDVTIADCELNFEKQHHDGAAKISENEEGIDHDMSTIEKSASSTSAKALQLFIISEIDTSNAIKCLTVSEKDVDHERRVCDYYVDVADSVNIATEFDVGMMEQDTINTVESDQSVSREQYGHVDITDPFIFGKGPFWVNDGVSACDSYMYIGAIETYDPEVKRGRFMEPLDSTTNDEAIPCNVVDLVTSTQDQKDSSNCLGADVNHECVYNDQCGTTCCLDFERDRDINANNIMGGVDDTPIESVVEVIRMIEESNMSGCIGDGIQESAKMQKQANKVHPRCARPAIVQKRYVQKQNKTSESETCFTEANEEKVEDIEPDVNYVNEKQHCLAPTTAEQIVDANFHVGTVAAETLQISKTREAYNIHSKNTRNLHELTPVDAAPKHGISDDGSLITSETFAFPEGCFANTGSILCNVSVMSVELETCNTIVDEVPIRVVKEQSQSFGYSDKPTSKALPTSPNVTANAPRKYGVPQLQKHRKSSKELPVKLAKHGTCSAIPSVNHQSLSYSRIPTSHSSTLPMSVTRPRGTSSLLPQLLPQSPIECHQLGLPRPVKWSAIKSERSGGEISPVSSLPKAQQVISDSSNSIVDGGSVSAPGKPAASENRRRSLSGIHPTRVIGADTTVPHCAAPVTHPLKSVDTSHHDPTLASANADLKSKIPVKKPGQ